MNHLLFSIVICTFNRVEYLKRVLNYLLKLHFDTNTFQIIIVDNNSSDTTKSFCLQFITDNPLYEIKYIFEVKQGLSNARNCGIKNSNGEIIVFLDDDALVMPDWLDELHRTFTLYKADVVGGKVELLYEKEKPIWLSQDLEFYLSTIDWGDKDVEIRLPDKWLVGANIAFKKEIFENYNFLSILGRSGEKLLSGEETELCERLQKNEKLIYYSSKAIVKHIVLPERLEKKFFLNRVFYGSYSNVLIKFVQENSYWEINKSFIKKIIRSIRDFFVILFIGKDIVFNIRLKLFYLYGYFKGLLYCRHIKKNYAFLKERVSEKKRFT